MIFCSGLSMRFSYPRRDTQSVRLFRSVWGIRFDDFGFKAYQPPLGTVKSPRREKRAKYSPFLHLTTAWFICALWERPIESGVRSIILAQDFTLATCRAICERIHCMCNRMIYSSTCAFVSTHTHTHIYHIQTHAHTYMLHTHTHTHVYK